MFISCRWLSQKPWLRDSSFLAGSCENSHGLGALHLIETRERKEMRDESKEREKMRDERQKERRWYDLRREKR